MGPFQTFSNEEAAQALYKKSDGSLVVGYKNKSHAVLLERRQAELRKDHLRVMGNYDVEERKIRKELEQFHYWQDNKNKRKFIILPLMEDEFGTNLAKHVETPRDDFYRAELAEIRKLGAMEKWDLKQAKSMDVKVHEMVNVKISPTIKAARYKVQKYSLHRKSMSAFEERIKKKTPKFEGQMLPRSHTFPLISGKRSNSRTDTFNSYEKSDESRSLVIRNAFTAAVDPLAVIRKRCENRKVWELQENGSDNQGTILDLKRAYGVAAGNGDRKELNEDRDRTFFPAIDSHVRKTGQHKGTGESQHKVEASNQGVPEISKTARERSFVNGIDDTRDKLKKKWSSVMPQITANSIVEGVRNTPSRGTISQEDSGCGGDGSGLASSKSPSNQGTSSRSSSRSKTVRFTPIPQNTSPAEARQAEERASIWEKLRGLKMSESGGKVDERLNRRRPSVQLKGLVLELLKNRSTAENIEYEKITGKRNEMSSFDDVRYLRQYTLKDDSIDEGDDCGFFQ